MSSRRRRVGLLFTLSVVTLLTIGLLIARFFFSGPRLAAFLKDTIFHNIKGSVEIGPIDWPFGALLGRNIPAVIHGVTIKDSHGNEVLHVETVTAEIDLPTVIFGRHDVLLDNVHIKGGWVTIAEVPADPGAERPWEVGFIAAFKPKVVLPGLGGPSPGPVIYCHNLTVEDVDVHLVFRDWNAHVYGVAAEGFLRQSFRNPNAASPDFTYALHARVPYGSVEFAGQHYDLVDVEANRFGQYPHEKDTLAYNARARTIDGADVRIEGKLTKVYDPDPTAGGVELRVDAYEAGLTLARMSFGYLFGLPSGTLHLGGKMAAPVLRAEARGIALVLPTPLNVEHAILTLDLATMNVDLTHAALRGLRGQAEARAKGNLTTMVLSTGTLTITKPLSLAPYLPREVAKVAGTELSGGLHVWALPYMLAADKINLQLGRLEVQGGLKVLGGELRTSGLRLTMAEGKANVAGVVTPSTGKVALDFALSVSNLPPLLARLGLPELARGVDISNGVVRGTLDAPFVAGKLAATGVRLTPRVDADLAYQHAPGGGRLEIKQASANPMGGTATATGAVVLGPRPRLDNLHVEAAGLDVAEIPGTGRVLAGKGRLALTASGPLARPRGKVEAEVADLLLAGKKVGDARLRVSADERRGVTIDGLTVGPVQASGTVGWAPYPMALDLHVKDLPLSLIPRPAPTPGKRALDLDGRVSADLRLGGNAARPTAVGKIGVAGLALFDTILGSGTLALSEEKGGRVHVAGRLFQNKVTLDGSVALGGPLGIDARGRVTLLKVDLEEIFAEELERISGHGWVSGTIDVRTAPDLEAELHLAGARLELDGTDLEGRPAPIIIESAGEIAARYDGTEREIRLLAPAVFRSATGGFTLEGSASERKLDARLRGDVQLQLLELYTRRWLDAARGSLAVDVALGGSAAKPTLDGKVTFRDAAVVPRQQEAELRLPAGELAFSLNQLRATGVTIEIEGQRLQLDGTVGLRALRPVALDARLTGRIAGKVVEMLAPEQITHAAGSAAATVTVRGTPSQPLVQGEIVIDEGLEIAPRALRRDVVLRSGRITFSQNQLVIDHLGGSIDEGKLDISGAARLTPRLWAALTIVADGITYRVPGVMEVELATDRKGVTLEYDRGGLELRGKLDIVDGRYVQPIRFDRVASNIAFPERTTEISDPFYKGSALLSEMRLDLDVETTGTFAVANQLINLTLDGSLNISGTPPRPILNGTVTENSRGEGTVRIPGIKIREFVVSLGRVDFSRYANFPTTTPTVLLRADAPFVDLTGTEHIVYLEITGTLSRYEWKLWTSTNLTQGQTMTLITFGRVTDELRARVRGAVQPTVITDSSRLPTSAATGSATDEVINELTGDVIDALIADTLRGWLSLDCFNFSVSGTSLRASACKKLGDIFLLSGQYEQGRLGWSRYEAGVTMRPADDLSFVLQGWGQTSEQEIESNRNAIRLQLKYNFTLR